MASITGVLDLSQIPPDQFDPQFEFRAAVVRNGAVLGSSTLTPRARARQISFQVSFDPPVLPSARLPCPVVLLIGPNVGDQELQSLETLRHEVDLRTTAQPSAAEGGAIDIGRLQVSAALYARWLIICRTYTIYGRVVCRQWQYDPVTGRGAFAMPRCQAPASKSTTSIAFCGGAGGLITSAVTDITGNFTITFRWCCLLWRPWLARNWSVDPDIFRRIQGLLAEAGIQVPPTPPAPDPLFLQQLAANATLSPSAARGMTAPGIIDMPASAEALRSVLPQSADLARLRVWPWFDWDDCDPDIVFRVTQVCGDQTRIIYSESNANVRVNIPTTLNVTLLANNQACCLPSCRDPECPECLDVTWVGCTPWPQISTTPVGGAPPPDLRGYAYASSMLDRPFYDTMQIRGAVGGMSLISRCSTRSMAARGPICPYRCSKAMSQLVRRQRPCACRTLQPSA